MIFVKCVDGGDKNQGGCLLLLMCRLTVRSTHVHIVCLCFLQDYHKKLWIGLASTKAKLEADACSTVKDNLSDVLIQTPE